MSLTVAPVTNTPAPQATPAPSRPAKSGSHSDAVVDTVQLSSTAQTVLTPTQQMMQDTDTHAQIVQAAVNGDPQAISLLAAEAALSFVQ